MTGLNNACSSKSSLRSLFLCFAVCSTHDNRDYYDANKQVPVVGGYSVNRLEECEKPNVFHLSFELWCIQFTLSKYSPLLITFPNEMEILFLFF